MTNLKEIQGLNSYCGPAVLAALTGKTTDECASVISSVTGRDRIAGVKPFEMIEVLKKLRFTVEEIPRDRTLYGTIMRIHNKDGMYIIGVPKHVIALEVNNGQVYLIDNHTKVALPANSSARLMQRVDLAWKVIQKDAPKYIGPQYRCDKYDGLFKIYQVNRYQNSEDDNQINLGSVRFVNLEELKNIIKAIEGAYNL